MGTSCALASMTLTGGGRDAAFGALPSELLQAAANKQIATARLRIIRFRRRFIGLQSSLRCIGDRSEGHGLRHCQPGRNPHLPHAIWRMANPSATAGKYFMHLRSRFLFLLRRSVSRYFVQTPLATNRASSVIIARSTVSPLWSTKVTSLRSTTQRRPWRASRAFVHIADSSETHGSTSRP